MGKVLKLRVLSVVCIVLAGLAAQSIVKANSVVTFGSFLKCLGGSICLLIGWISSNISRRQPSETRSIPQLFAIWTFLTFMYLYSKLSSRVKNCKSRLIEDQEKYLLNCLKINKNTKYSLEHDLSDVKSVSSFRERHPLTSYDHYRPYVERCLKGEENVLISEKYPVDFFALTSGTSGKNKVYPYNHSLTTGNFQAQSPLSLTVIRNYNFMDVSILPCALLIAVPQFAKTELGLRTGSVGSYFIDEYPTAMICPPKILYSAKRKSPITEKEFYYTSLIFILQERMSCILHSLAASTVTFYAIMEAEWPSICDNIEHGTIPDNINFVANERAELLSKLEPNPGRAEELRAEFSKGMRGIVRRVWPDINVVFCLLSGAFSKYRDVLSVYLDGVWIYSNNHLSTEGVFGINVWPTEDTIKYALVPSGLFFEFIPEDETAKEDPSTVLAHQVEVGKRYEIVVTSSLGLYRYRIGDVIEVIGFEEQLPVYLFKYRLGQMLNACWEKIPECAFLDAVSKTSKDWGEGMSIHQYMATENFNMTNVPGSGMSSSSKGYVVFVEFSEESVSLAETDKKVSSKEAQSSWVETSDHQQKFHPLDDNLRLFHELYDIIRKNGSLEQMRVFQVKQGTFDRLRDKLLEANVKTSPAQFKMPRVQRNKEYLEYLWTSTA